MANNKIDKVFPKVDWDGVTSTMASDGKLRLAVFAKEYGVSIPTMRKILERKYGAKIQFRRGRTGGVFPASGFPFPSPVTATAAPAVARVNYSEDSSSATMVEDAETESIVDSILGIES